MDLPPNVAESFDLEEATRANAHQERAFRRGFLHGYEMALELARSGVDLEEMAKHAGRLDRWREEGIIEPFFDPAPDYHGREGD